jgi:hypothetical protein
MAGDRLFDPSSSLTIRPPQDNGSPGDKIRNPPRYMQLGGITSGRVAGFMANGFGIKTPGNTQTKVPMSKNPKGY